jgi:dolichol-phosphate mannosyltransferase
MPAREDLRFSSELIGKPRLGLNRRQLCPIALFLQPAGRTFWLGEIVKRVSVVAPMFNEKDSIPLLAQTLTRLRDRLAPDYELECVLVDDGSGDGSNDEARRHFASLSNVIILQHARNCGPGAAVRTGFAKATGQIVCTIDSDCTFDPLKIRPMLQQLETSKLDIVTASPYHPQGGVENVPPWRLLLSRGASVLYRRVCSCKLYTYTSFMRVYRREVIDTVRFNNNGFAAFTEILLRAAHQGYRIGEFPEVLKARASGTSKMKVLYTIRTHMSLMAQALWWRISSRNASMVLARNSLGRP